MGRFTKGDVRANMPSATSLRSSRSDCQSRENAILSKKTVQFAGFILEEDKFRPSPKMFEAIENFKQPSNVNEMRAWFGLVNQLSYATKLNAIMEPFRYLLKKDTKFEWSEELNAAFQKTKLKLIEEVKDGIYYYDMGKETCLSPDWSKDSVVSR